MTLEEILQNKDFAIHKKKSEIQKTDFSNILFDTATKTLGNNNTMLEVLVYEVNVSKSRNPLMFEQYKSGYVLNHSVGMRYVKILLCYNTEDAGYSQEKENWDKYYPNVVNKDEADKYGYFWAVTEAKNIEASAVVKGSNFLTPVLSAEEIDENTIKVKLAVSPSNIIDSHRDCHIAGLWKKSLNENPYELLLQEHDMDFDKVIADSINSEFSVYTEMISVKELLSKFKKGKKSEADKGHFDDKNEPTNVTQNKTIHLFI
jgi:hypothetical protein